ncbi:hypothetical protein Xcom_20345 [Xanthomonas axonopodis pv. commiphoreae]|nr:hypothetical protein Xcom_20345 [Xanthomonas axonopodis pv. commiphoreae]
MARRPATEADVIEGRAVFYIPGGSEPVDFTLPCCALQRLESGESEPVVVVQAEHGPSGVILGVRPLCGGNGICMLSEVELLPDGFPLQDGT